MATIKLDKVQEYRRETYRQKPGKRVKTKTEAAQFIKQRGFVFFWSIKGVTLPSLWGAVAGDRPVASAHDDPGHITWGWKDEMLGQRAWYYAKLLRKRATMISFDTVPYFYALSENYGSPEDDYLTLYEQGRLTQEAKAVYEAILDEGPLDTVALRRKTHMTSRASDSRFNRAMTHLQADFKIVPVGVTKSGGWRYAFAYDIVPRRYPELPELAQQISEKRARQKLVTIYFQSVGAAQMRDVLKVFQWPAAVVKKSVDSLANDGFLRHGLRMEKHEGEWIALDQLV